MRSDIQALRGLAVLLVLASHAKLGMAAGHLGVDIFFVISGYLITGMVGRSIERGDFSFAGFYWRRAKRLLPAAYVTFAATALLAPFLLTAADRTDFTSQMVGALTFTANIALCRQTDYFAATADTKPLLHIWSLSIEEQYYLLLPLLLFVAPRRWRVPGALAVLAASLLACLWIAPSDPAQAFFLLQYRAWELAIGSLGALALDRPTAMPQRSLRLLFWPAAAALLVVPAMPWADGQAPGVEAMVVCTATLIVILRRHEEAAASLPVRGLAWVGDFSYSLYLVHWPIFAFANNTLLSGKLPLPFRLGGAALAIAFGWLLYRFVERPIRAAELAPTGRRLAGILMASLTILALPLASIALRAKSPDYAELRRINFGLDRSCETDGPFTVRPACRTGDNPRLLVWGDSFAMHLVPGIAASIDVPFEQATASGCGPYLDGAPAERSERCLAFNRSVIDHIAATPSIEAVVVAGIHAGPGDLLQAALLRSIERLHALGKRVVLVAPPPSAATYSIGACVERRARGMPSFGAPPDCRIDVVANLIAHDSAFQLLKGASAASGAPVFYFEPFLCDEHSCPAEQAGLPLYRDANHLSVDGSRWIGAKIQLGRRLMEMAR